MITKSELYAYTMESLVEKELRALLAVGLLNQGSEIQLRQTIGWTASRIKSLLGAAPPPDLPGPPIVSLAIDSLDGATYVQTRGRLERILINAFGAMEPEISNRQMARFFLMDEKKIRRLRAPQLEADDR